MRITAEFYTADEAEFAAAALRQITDGVFDIAIREHSDEHHEKHSSSPAGPIGFFANINTGSMTGVPVPYYNVSEPVNIPDIKKNAVIDVICRPSAAHRVYSVLVAKGGHRIKGAG